MLTVSSDGATIPDPASGQPLIASTTSNARNKDADFASNTWTSSPTPGGLFPTSRSTIIVRIFSPDGQFRITVDTSITFASLAPLIAERLPKDVDLTSLTFNHTPWTEGRKLISDVKNITLRRVGVKYVRGGVVLRLLTSTK
jgi:hypothetical protein